MKFNKMLLLVLAVQFLMISASFNGASAEELVSDKSFELFMGGSPNHSDVSGFVGDYSVANTVNNDTTLDLGEDVDALLLPGNQDGLTSAELAKVAEWFALGGKMLWVAGDSDYGAYFIAGKLNPVLKEVGSVLRLDAGAIDDKVNNDGSGYRVRSVGHGDGEIATAVFDGIANDTMPFHGPTSVEYVDADGKLADLRGADVANVEVVITSSKDATPLDQDVSLGDDDFYFSIANDTATGSYPLLAVEKIDKGWVIVSGESIFTSYKFMYGNEFEKSGQPHVGKQVVDRLISYYFTEVQSSGLPVNNLAIFAALLVPAAVVYKRRK